MKQTNSAIDVGKIFFCICIIALHTGLFMSCSASTNYYITKIVLRLAVPFFFVASGYFLGKKLCKIGISEYQTVILNYCRRLLIPLLVFEAINFMESCIFNYLNGSSLGDIFMKTVKAAIFYPPGALWFIQACIVAAMLLLPFLKGKRLGLALVIGFILYLFGLLCNNYHFLVEDTVMQRVVDFYMDYCRTARNGLFVGFLLIGLGIKCAQIEWKESRVIKYLIIAGGIYVLEILFLRNKIPADDGALLISHILIAPMLLLMLSQSKYTINYKLSILLRNLSTGMYLLHKPILFLVAIGTGSVILRFSITTIIALGICLFAYKTKFLRIDKLLK